jgi:hypothetical protein
MSKAHEPANDHDLNHSSVADGVEVALTGEGESHATHGISPLPLRPLDTRHTPPQSAAAPLGLTCQATVKATGLRCTYPPVKSGVYSGQFCRVHATDAHRTEVKKDEVRHVKINTDTGAKDDGTSQWTCSQCGQGAQGTIEEYESDYVASPGLGLAHRPENARKCQLCGAKVVHVTTVARTDDGYLLTDCQSRHVEGEHDADDLWPCFWSTTVRHYKVCHADWAASCHERAGWVPRVMRYS